MALKLPSDFSGPGRSVSATAIRCVLKKLWELTNGSGLSMTRSEYCLSISSTSRGRTTFGAVILHQTKMAMLLRQLKKQSVSTRVDVVFLRCLANAKMTKGDYKGAIAAFEAALDK